MTSIQISLMLCLMVSVNTQIKEYPNINKVDFTQFINSPLLQSQLNQQEAQTIKETVHERSQMTRLNFKLLAIKNYYAPELPDYGQGLIINRFLISVLIGSTMLVGFIMYMLIVKLLKWKKQKRLNRFTQTYTRKYQYTVGGLLAAFLLMNLVTSILVFVYVIREFQADQMLKSIVKNNMKQYGSELQKLESIMEQTCTSNPKLNEFYIQISQCKTQPAPKFFDEQMTQNMKNIVSGSKGIQSNNNWQIASFVSEILLFIFILISLAWISYAIRQKLQYQFQLSSYIYCFIASISFMNIYFYAIVISKRIDICGAAIKHIGKNDYVINEGFFHYIPLYTTDTKVQLRRSQQYNYELTRFNIDNYLKNLNDLVQVHNLTQFQSLIDKSTNVQEIIKQSADQLYQNNYGNAQTIVKQNINILAAIKLNNDAQNKFKFLIENVPIQQMMVDLEKDYCITSHKVRSLQPKVTAILRSFSLLAISILSQSVVNILISKKLQKYKKQEINSVRKQLL